MSPRSPIPDIRRKLRAKGPLTPQEREAWNAHHRKYSQGATKLYFHSQARLDALQTLAKKEGAAIFNQWLLDKIELGASGTHVPQEYLDRLNDDLKKEQERAERALDEVQNARGQVKLLQTENARLNAKIDEYAQEFMKLLKAVAKGDA